MGIFKTGHHIGVCCKGMDTAITFMRYVFNIPIQDNFSSCSVKFEYDNSDLVEWIEPTKHIIGEKFDFIFCDTEILSDEYTWFINDVLNPMRESFSTKIGCIPNNFNENREKYNDKIFGVV